MPVCFVNTGPTACFITLTREPAYNAIDVTQKSDREGREPKRSARKPPVNCITIRDSFVGTREDMAETLAFAPPGARSRPISSCSRCR